MFSFKHLDCVMRDHPVKFLGRIIKMRLMVRSPWSPLGGFSCYFSQDHGSNIVFSNRIAEYTRALPGLEELHDNDALPIRGVVTQQEVTQITQEFDRAAIDLSNSTYQNDDTKMSNARQTVHVKDIRDVSHTRIMFLMLITSSNQFIQHQSDHGDDQSAVLDHPVKVRMGIR